MPQDTISTRTYFLVYAALLGLLVVTVAVAMVPLGMWGPVVAIGIAGAKTALILLDFMHVRYERRLVQVFSVAGFLWLAILLILLLGDYLTREGLAAG